MAIRKTRPTLYKNSQNSYNMTHILLLILMTHDSDWITIQIPFIRSPRLGIYCLFGQENVNFHNFMVGFDGWMCHNGPTSSTTSKSNCVGVGLISCIANTGLKTNNFSSIWSNQKSKECCKRRKSRRTDWWLIRDDSLVMTHPFCCYVAQPQLQLLHPSTCRL